MKTADSLARPGTEGGLHPTGNSASRSRLRLMRAAPAQGPDKRFTN